MGPWMGPVRTGGVLRLQTPPPLPTAPFSPVSLSYSIPSVFLSLFSSPDVAPSSAPSSPPSFCPAPFLSFPFIPSSPLSLSPSSLALLPSLLFPPLTTPPLPPLLFPLLFSSHSSLLFGPLIPSFFLSPALLFSPSTCCPSSSPSSVTSHLFHLPPFYISSPPHFLFPSCLSPSPSPVLLFLHPSPLSPFLVIFLSSHFLPLLLFSRSRGDWVGWAGVQSQRPLSHMSPLGPWGSPSCAPQLHPYLLHLLTFSETHGFRLDSSLPPPPLGLQTEGPLSSSPLHGGGSVPPTAYLCHPRPTFEITPRLLASSEEGYRSARGRPTIVLLLGSFISSQPQASVSPYAR
uniref:Uncharacterized protein n=1 Tax=Mustela putorius furo TaxID=9669 RepID=M3Z5J0_MUSPF